MLKLVAVLAAVLCVVLAAPKSKHPIPADGRIIGGKDANIADFPWQVSVQAYNSHFCGGFLISNTWVVTAAHCLNVYSASLMSIRAGSSKWNSGGQTVKVAKIISHPNYQESILNNDIGLIQLASPVTIANAKPGVLPAAGKTVPADESLTITGWGVTKVNGAIATTLQKVSVPTLSRATCQHAYKPAQITNQMFCAGLLGIGGKDSCQGDSGGPAVLHGEIVGIVSWGYGCADKTYPGVYTKVSSVRAWIKQNTGI